MSLMKTRLPWWELVHVWMGVVLYLGIVGAIGRSDLVVDQTKQVVRNILVRGVGKATLHPCRLIVVVPLT